MTSRWKRREHQPAQPLSNRAITLGAVMVLGSGTAAFIVLWWRYGGIGPSVELDLIRTAGGLMAGAGAAIALLLAARRQRSTELALEHQREVAVATERDGAERRITELYTRAVDQLGDDKAPVRLGALHALERLAQNNPVQRQTIVDVLCAYLRMPYTPPDDQAPGEGATEDAHHRYEQRRQELQVRLTAQRILSAHLNPVAATVFWADTNLNLTEAHLHELDLTTCYIHTARFDGATFTGDTIFGGAQFAGDTRFDGAQFAGDTEFGEAQFAGDTRFDGAQFAEDAMFGRAQFGRDTAFDGAQFAGTAAFGEAQFAGITMFGGAQFAGTAIFDGAQFAKDVMFDGAQFGGKAAFDGAQFGGDAAFDWTKFTGTAVFDGAQFAGDAGFGRAQFAGDAGFRGAEFTENTGFTEAQFAGTAGFDGARIALSARHASLPLGWITRAAQPAEKEGWLYMVRAEDSTFQPGTAWMTGKDRTTARPRPETGPEET